MFPSKSRPVPSPAALRVLYQLAYVSSGTAVGLGVLYGEERRRRIHILQKVADNARRLKQSPRHISNNAAATAAATAVNADPPTDSGSEGVEFGQGDDWLAKYYKRKREQLKEKQKGAAEASGVSNRSSAAKRDHRPVASDKRRRANSSGSAQDARKERTLRSHRPLTDSNALRGSSVTRDPGDKSAGDVFNTKSACVGTPKLLDTVRQWQQDFLFDTRAADHIPDDVTQAPALAHPHHIWNASDQVSTTIDDLHRHTDQSKINAMTHDLITTDVKKFLDWSASAVRSESSAATTALALRLADQLLIVACQNGSVDNILSLCHWKLTHGVWTDNDFTSVSREAVNLAFLVDHKDLFNLYLNLFGTAPSFVQDDRLRVESAIFLLQISVEWDLDIKIPKRIEALLGPHILTHGSTSVIETLQQESTKSLRESRVTILAEIMFAVLNFSAGEHQTLAHVHLTKEREQLNILDSMIDTLFNAAMVNKQFSACTRLLQIHRLVATHLRRTSVYQTHLNAFVEACGRERKFGLLTDTPMSDLGIDDQAQGNNILNDQNKEILNAAFAMDTPTSGDFRKIPAALLPENSRSTEGRKVGGAIMDAAWHATANIEAVKARHTRLRRRLEEDGDHNGLLPLDLALLEFILKAGHIEKAADVLKQLRYQHGTNADVMSVTALLLAQTRAWDSLAKLLDIAAAQGESQITGESTRRFNRVLRLFARDHGCVDTLEFIKDLIDRSGLVPNIFTFKIFLQSLVAGRRLDLIPAWLQFLSTRKIPFCIDTGVMVSLMRTFYRDHRPPNVLFMAQCRYIAKKLPWLDVKQLLNPIQEAIAYDLRHLSGRHAPWLRENARVRLERVRKAKGEVPDPGWTFNRKLYFDYEKYLQAKTAVRDRKRRGVGHSVYESNGLKVDDALEGPQAQSLLLKTPGSERLTSEPALQEHSPIPELDIPFSCLGKVGNFPSQTPTQGSTMLFPISSREDLLNGHKLRESSRTGHNRTTQSDRTVQMHTLEGLHSSQMEAGHDDEEFMNGSNDGSEHQIDPVSGSNTGNLSQTVPATGPSPEGINVRTPTYSNNRQFYLRSVREMTLALSLGEYDKVLRQYRSHQKISRSSITPLCVQLAVEASMRQNHGYDAEAEELMAEAREMGINLQPAMSSYLVNLMNNMSLSDQQDALKLRRLVEEYYQSNEQHGWQVSHYIGVHAAYTLIKAHQPRQGLDLLTSILASEAAVIKPLDIVAMTVFLRGYTTIWSVKGILWVIGRVLEQDMRISLAFQAQLKFSLSKLTGRIERNRFPDKVGINKVDDREAAALSQALSRIQKRRAAQKLKSRKFGWRVVSSIIDAGMKSNDDGIKIGARAQIGEGVFGGGLTGDVPLLD